MAEKQNLTTARDLFVAAHQGRRKQRKPASDLFMPGVGKRRRLRRSAQFVHRHWTPRRRWWSVLPAGKGGRKRDGEGERERRTLPRAALPPPPLTRHRRCLASADAAYPPSVPRLRHESLPIVVPLAVCSL
nr:hypothetical protein Iba_chr13bCG14700 [Ipomoea batatas]